MAYEICYEYEIRKCGKGKWEKFDEAGYGYGIGIWGWSWGRSWVLGMEFILHEARSVLEAYERMDLRYHGFFIGTDKLRCLYYTILV